MADLDVLALSGSPVRTPSTSAPAAANPAHDAIIALLRAYRQSGDLVEALPAIVWLRTSKGPVGRHLRLPCVRWFVRPLLARHVARTVAALNRRANALASTGDGSGAEQADIAALDRCERSLRLVAYRRVVIGFILGAFVFAYAIANIVQSDRARVIGDFTTALVELDRKAAVTAVTHADWVQAVSAGVIVLWALWLSLLLPSLAFRLKRAVFNLRPGAVAEMATATAKDNASRSAGVYELEDAAFRALGAAPTREVPLDLIHPALLIASVFIVGVAGAISPNQNSLATNLAIGGWFVALAAAATGGMVRVARRRSGVDAPPQTLATSGPWRRRVVAHLLDSTILISVAVTVTFVAPVKPSYGKFLVAFLVVALFYSLLICARRGAHRGQTFGRQALGLRTVRADGSQASTRAIVAREALLKWGVFSFTLVVVPTLIDAAWAFWDDENRCLHDVVAGTRLIRSEGMSERPRGSLGGGGDESAGASADARARRVD